MRLVRDVLQLLLFVPLGPRPWYSIIVWWELRRIAYNIVMLFVGVTGLSLFLLIDELPPQVTVEESDWEPISIFIFGFLANVFYTGGWMAELAIFIETSNRSSAFGPVAFKRGLLFSCVLCFLPAVGNEVLWILRIIF